MENKFAFADAYRRKDMNKIMNLVKSIDFDTLSNFKTAIEFWCSQKNDIGNTNCLYIIVQELTRRQVISGNFAQQI